MPEQSFAGKLSSLAEIGRFIRRSAQDARFSPKDAYALELAVDEICTNIIEHGYRGDSSKHIICSVKETEQGITIQILDEAPLFQPSLPPRKWDNPPLEQIKRRGIGIILVYQLMDEVRYERRADKQGNLITLVKKRTTS